jgi:hypothetical protein
MVSIIFVEKLLSSKLIQTDFSIPNTTNAFGYITTEANFIKPFKRPLSSISPTIVEFPNGTVYLACFRRWLSHHHGSSPASLARA